MKFSLKIILASCIVALAASVEITTYQSSLGKSIQKALEEFKRCMPVGFPDMGLPVLSPLNIERQNLVVESKSDLSLLNITILDSVLQEIHNFHINDVDMSILFYNANFDFLFPSVFLAGYHETFAKVLIVKIPLTGVGEYAVRVNDLRIVGNLTLKPMGSIIGVDDIKLTVTMKSLTSKIRGVLGPISEILFNKIIESAAVGILEDYQDTINELARGFIPKINEMLGPITLSELLSKIRNLGSTPMC